jgi:hypothetical protein
MSFNKQLGTLVSGTVNIAAAATPTVIIAGNAGEFIDVYNITVASTDTALVVVTLDDGTTTFSTLVVTSSQATVPALFSIPIRLKAGSSVRATLATLTATKNVYVTVSGIRSRT